MEDRFEVSYITTLPKEGNSPQVSIYGWPNKKYIVKIFDRNIEQPIFQGECITNSVIIPKLKQWYTNWIVKIFDENNVLVFEDIFDVQGKTVFIKMDAWALGDTIAWIPYVEEFRKQKSCNIICSTFYNEFLFRAYPNIMFVKPNTQINNVYAQYYIGASNDDNLTYTPIKVNNNPLQKIASATLGLEHIEICPNLKSQILHAPRKISGKYVCISEFGSHEDKHWKVVNGWQSMVRKLKAHGYKVVVISKEPTTLTGVIDKTGDINLFERMVDLMYSDMFIGISSGLSWLSWALGTHVVMISDVTPNWHEFQSNISRLNANDLMAVNYVVENETSIETVFKKLEELGVS